MKQLKVIGLLVVGIWVAYSGARGQIEQGTGSYCRTDTPFSCGLTCMTGSVSSSLCLDSPDSQDCCVWNNAKAQEITFYVCVPSTNSTNTCTPEVLEGDGPIDCGEADNWLCGCMNADHYCGYTGCKCTGVKDGSDNFEVNSTCTD